MLRKEEPVKERSFVFEKWLTCEQALALNALVCEAEYALYERTTVQQLTSTFERKLDFFIIKLCATLSINDFKAKQQ